MAGNKWLNKMAEKRYETGEFHDQGDNVKKQYY
jgi:hypothetical protein